MLALAGLEVMATELYPTVKEDLAKNYEITACCEMPAVITSGYSSFWEVIGVR